MPDQTDPQVPTPKHKFADKAAEVAFRREAFAALNAQEAKIHEAEQAVETEKKAKTTILEAILDNIGPGPFKQNGVLYRLRKVKNGGVVASTIDTNVEDVNG